MTRTTKLELQQALNTMGEEVQRLRIEVSTLRGDRDMWRERAESFAAIPPMPDHPAHRRAPAVKPPSAFQLACAAAREMAQRTGKCIKVGA